MTSAKWSAALVVMGVLVIALAAVALPAFQGARTPASTTAAVTAVVTTSGGNHTFTQSPGAVVSSPACAGTTEAYGNLTWTSSPCVSYGFPSPILKNATLDSRQVLPFIKTAYEYHVVYFAFGRSDPKVTYAVLNVTGSQVVTGNWTTAYRVSYVGNRLLNVTIRHVVASTYEVTHVSSYSLPDRNESVAYAPQQVQAVQAALSNSTVRSLMVDPAYYAGFVGHAGNGTAYLVEFYQVDGTRVVGAFVNTSPPSVTSSYTVQRFSGECWPDGIVITDPWSAASYSGCKA